MFVRWRPGRSRTIRRAVAAGAAVLLATSAMQVMPAAAADPAQAGLYRYGINFPYGLSAVDYAYSDQGMWKDTDNLRYTANYYQDWEFLTPEDTTIVSPGHDWNKPQLITDASQPGVRYTARDKNGHLLFDADRDGNLDLATGGNAFHEHNGKGKNAQPPATEPNQAPFHQFWFDDNWLARHMAQAYGRPLPNGLSDNGDHIRWRILSGDLNWTPHDKVVPAIPSDNVDRLALDGLYYLAKGDRATALKKWERIIAKSGSAGAWNAGTRLWTYPKLIENYHIGLAKLLTEQVLVQHTGLSVAQQRTLQSHAVSLRALLVENQQRAGGTGALTGWTTDAHLTAGSKSLINIESIAVNTLALGAGAKFVYTPGQAPLQTHAAGNYRRTAGGLLSAVPGASATGHMTFGPNSTLPPGTYNVDFVMRSTNPAAGSQVANIEVFDARSGTSVTPVRILRANEFATNGGYDNFIRFTVPITVTSADNSLEYRVWWYGGSNPLDIAEIRVR